MRHLIAVAFIWGLVGCGTAGTTACPRAFELLPPTVDYALVLVQANVPPEKIEAALKMPAEEAYAEIRRWTSILSQIGKSYCPKPKAVEPDREEPSGGVDPPPAEEVPPADGEGEGSPLPDPAPPLLGD